MFDQEPFSVTKIIRNRGKKWTQGGGGGHFTIFLYTRIREGRDVGRVLLKCMCHVQAALKYSAHKSILWVFISGPTSQPIVDEWVPWRFFLFCSSHDRKVIADISSIK